MKTAIVGLGHIGGQLAANLMAGGEKLILVDKDDGHAEALAEQSGGRARAALLPAAIAESDVMILAILFDAIKELLSKNRDKLEGKIVVDPSNPIAPDGKGGFRKIVPENRSAGQMLASLIPPGANFVKAFGSLSATSLKAGANRSPERAVLFYASDDKFAGDEVARLITVSGFDPVRVGGIDQAIRIEAFGDLHEFGKLGRLVTAEEAARLI